VGLPVRFAGMAEVLMGSVWQLLRTLYSFFWQWEDVLGLAPLQVKGDSASFI